MPDIVVFDIETYRPNWRIRRTSREDLNPARNTITTTGVFDGEKLSISPVIRNLEEERKSVEFFLRKLEESRGSTLVGYNTLHFDIPYLVYKSKRVGSNCDLTQFQPLALYWILPYWLHNTLDGREFFNKGPRLGNLWKFENVVKYILREKANPFSNFDVLRLWEEKRFDDIEALVKDEIAERPRLELSAVINPRLKDAIIRELFAHAFLRTAFQNGFKNIDELQYTEEDVDFIQSRLSHFVDFSVSPIIAEAFTRVSKRKPKIEVCMEAILQCLADGKWHLPEEVVPFVEDRFCTLGREVSEATIYNSFKRLKTLRKIDHQYNRYRIAEVIINGKKD